MKIVHVSTNLGIGGGAEAVLYRLVTGDRDNEHIVVSLREKDGYGEMLADKGVRVEALGMSRARLSVTGLIRLWKLLKNEKPDVLQTWMYHGNLVGGLAGYFARVPRIIWGLHHTDLDVHGTSMSTRVVARIGSLLSHFVPFKVISCSVAGVAAHERMGYSKNRFVVCNNGYDFSEFTPITGMKSELINELGLIKTDVILVGMAARWNPQKDHGNLIDALKQLVARGNVGWCCLLMGVGMDSSNQELQTLLDESGLAESVLLLGIRSDMPRIMAALDLHILSSRFGEAFPNVLNEAMSCGTPCVSTDVGDSALIVGGTGWVVPISRPDLLADAMEDAIYEYHSPEWEGRCKRCRDRVIENFGVEKMVVNYSKVWSA